MTEVWAPVHSLNDMYEVSNLGRVRSLPRETQCKDGSTRRYPGKMLNVSASGGYPFINASLGPNNHKLVYVHKIVAETFLAEPPCPGMMIIHKDGDSFNNKVSNLAWVKRTQPKANSRQVIDTDTHRVFYSASTAEHELGISGVARSIRGGYKCHGHKFEYYEGDE